MFNLHSRLLLDNGIRISNRKDIADRFNIHFSIIGRELDNKTWKYNNWGNKNATNESYKYVRLPAKECAVNEII